MKKSLFCGQCAVGPNAQNSCVQRLTSEDDRAVIGELFRKIMKENERNGKPRTENMRDAGRACAAECLNLNAYD
jgi:hypothetical protein